MRDLIRDRAQYPNLTKMVDLIAEANPFQRKRISKFIGEQDDEYWNFAEALIQSLSDTFLQSELDWREATQSYNRLCIDVVQLQIAFRKTGVYKQSSANTAYDNVYNQPQVMKYYMVGLLLTYLFWPNQYRMFRFYCEELDRHRDTQNYLEVGIGHGLFVAEALRRLPKMRATLVDISETSIKLAKEILTTFSVDTTRANFIQGDFFKTTTLLDHNFDLIVMGELMEHVSDVKGLMDLAYRLLKRDGIVFISTCVNCPAVDHVYHFHTVEEIRVLLRAAGFSIAHELALPAEAVSEAMWAEELVTINYCAILTPEGSP